MKSLKGKLNITGNHIKFLKNTLRQSITKESIDNIVDASVQAVESFIDPSEQTGERRGLIFGRIQSGKTNTLTGALAMAADNGFKCFVVLTSDNLWLYDQTLSRLKKALPGVFIVSKEDWAKKTDAIKKNLELEGVIFVCTKNGTHLSNLSDIISETKATKYPAVIFDDEADQASLDTNIGKEDDDPSRINALISDLRQKFQVRTYVQVTATPQALFLQGLTNDYRPEFTVITEPGKGYIGGETFFADPDYEHLLAMVDEEEVDSLVSAKIANTNKSIPQGLKAAVCTFFVGATIKFLKDEGSSFSFLCHISLKKVDHEHIRSIVQRFVDDMSTVLKKGDERKKRIYEKSLRNAYDNLLLSVSDAPPFEEVLDQLSFSISGTDIQVLNTDGKNYSGQPSYDRFYNILIGGNKLGRGVTIERLLVTYYGRQARNPQLDTVLQHARMYGYRKKDLDVSRIFLPPHLADRFRVIYNSETDLREVIEKNKDTGTGFRGIWLTKNLKPTRGNVLDPNEIGVFAAGKAYFPHRPLFKKKDVADDTIVLNNLLESYPAEPNTKAHKVDMSFVIKLLQHTKSDTNSPGLWRDDRILAALEQLAGKYPNAYLLVRKDRNLSFKDTPRGLGAVYQSDELKLADADLPTVLMLRQKGTKSGWDNQEFWIPVVRFPEGSYAIMFNLS